MAIFVLDNWCKLTGFGVKGFSKMSGIMDKGQKNNLKLLMNVSKREVML